MMGRKVFVDRKNIGVRINTGGTGVGTTVVSLSNDDRELKGGVQVLAAATNSGTVYVGTRDNLTAGTNNPTDGYPLAAGGSIFLPAAKESDIKAIASAVSQQLFWVSH